MVRPKKIPTSTTLISRKTVVSKSKNTNDEIVKNIKKIDSNDNSNNKKFKKKRS